MDQPRIRRKRVTVSQSKLDRVMEMLDTTDESDAIDQALTLLFRREQPLDPLIFRDELIEGVWRIGGSGGLDDPFGEVD